MDIKLGVDIKLVENSVREALETMQAYIDLMEWKDYAQYEARQQYPVFGYISTDGTRVKIND
ncbi:MAG: hypothetical protein WC455_22145 [Dehalococcoidia bacterium]|jgi:hypothetical protein